MDDKRLTHRLTNYWNHLRGEYSLPEWKMFDMVSFHDIWRQCCGWSVDSNDASALIYTYEYMGESVQKVAGQDLTGKKFVSRQTPDDPSAVNRSVAASKINEMLSVHFNNFPAARLLQKLDRVVKRPGLVIEEGRADNVLGEEVRYRSCLLPFGAQDGKVTHMVLGLSWKAYKS